MNQLAQEVMETVDGLYGGCGSNGSASERTQISTNNLGP